MIKKIHAQGDALSSSERALSVATAKFKGLKIVFDNLDQPISGISINSASRRFSPDAILTTFFLESVRDHAVF
jgi:hypothetical protein